MIDVLEKAHVSTPMQGLTLKVDDERLAVRNLQECLQVVSLHFLWIVEHIELHLITWLQDALSRMHIEDLIVKDMLLEGLFRCGLAGIGPWLQFDLRVIR